MFFLKKFKKGKRGVTLLEIILVLAILAILAASSVGGLSAYRGKQVLSGETSQVAAIFSKARSQTLASRSELSYGVRLETDRVTLYTGRRSIAFPEPERSMFCTILSILRIFLSLAAERMFFLNASLEKRRLTGRSGLHFFRILPNITHFPLNRRVLPG
jgi:prepilin-type N-terminal cleavage/methylation domain-containing protein